MNTATIRHSTGSFMYWNMLKNLDADTKLDLISKLSASLLEREKPATTNLADKYHGAWAAKLAGRWQDARTAEEIVSDIREARTPNREIEDYCQRLTLRSYCQA